MADILSQAEIDSLLSALSDGQLDVEDMKTATPQKKVRIYDFKRPNKFSKDQIHSLQNIFENYCRSLTTYFSGNLHSAIETKALSIDQITYDEFIRSLPNPTILAIFNMNPLEGTLLLEMSPSLAFTMIERLLGGSGTGNEKSRVLTEIEHTIIEHRISQIVTLMEEAWSAVYEVKNRLISVESNPQFTQIVAPNEMVLLVTLEVKVDDKVGMINVCLPYLVLEPILDKLSTLLLFSTQSKITAPGQVQIIRQKIERAKVELTVMLGQTEITVRDLLQLEPGDVIPLMQSVQDPLAIYVGNYDKFRGLPGLNGEHLAVQITEFVEEGGNKDG